MSRLPSPPALAAPLGLPRRPLPQLPARRGCILPERIASHPASRLPFLSLTVWVPFFF